MSSSGDGEPPEVDHHAHLRRIAIELSQIVAIVMSVASVVSTGMSARSCVAIALAGGLTLIP